jgi:hypothetical protein
LDDRPVKKNVQKVKDKNQVTPLQNAMGFRDSMDDDPSDQRGKQPSHSGDHTQQPPNLTSPFDLPFLGWGTCNELPSLDTCAETFVFSFHIRFTLLLLHLALCGWLLARGWPGFR